MIRAVDRSSLYSRWDNATKRWMRATGYLGIPFIQKYVINSDADAQKARIDRIMPKRAVALGALNSIRRIDGSGLGFLNRIPTPKGI